MRKFLSITFVLGLFAAFLVAGCGGEEVFFNPMTGEFTFPITCTPTSIPDATASTITVTGKNFNNFTTIQIDSGSGWVDQTTNLDVESPDLGEDGQVSTSFTPSGQESIKVRVCQALMGGTIYSEACTITVTPAG